MSLDPLRIPNRLAADHDARRVRLETEFDKIERKQRSLMDAIMEGTPARLVNAELAALETRRSEVEAQLQAVPPPLPRLHPNLPELYRRKVEDLQEALRAAAGLAQPIENKSPPALDQGAFTVGGCGGRI